MVVGPIRCCFYSMEDQGKENAPQTTAFGANQIHRTVRGDRHCSGRLVGIEECGRHRPQQWEGGAWR